LAPRLFFFFYVFFLAGCASYQTKVSPARDHLAQGNCAAAIAGFEALAQPESGDQLVYLLDYASALQICEDYKKSNEIFLRAERLAEQSDYHSVSRVAGATFLNEEMIQYKGDTFEKLFINASLALNFIKLGQLDSALVEVRKLNQKFTKLSAEDKKPFELNAFSKYLSGLIWELDKKFDDACIDYKDSFFLDTSYRQVGQDMLRACWRAKRHDEFKTLAKRMSATDEEIALAKVPRKAEVVVVLLQGWGPRKVPRDSISARLVPRPSQTSHIRLKLGESTHISSPIYSVSQAAIRTLENDYAALVARRIAARAAKEILADQVRQKDSALGAAAWLVMVASERADLRQWSVLPETIHVLRVPLNPGDHQALATGLDASGAETETFPETSLKLRAGEQKLLILRTLK
jgi:uncharacterized protein